VALVARIVVPLATGRPYFDDVGPLMNGALTGMPV